MSKPISKSDIRFTESWKEQREGSKAGYYLLYTFSWGLAIIFIIFFILMFLGGISIIPIAQDNNKIVLIVVTGFVLGFATSLFVRARNEKRYWKILSEVKKDRAEISLS
ncbi:MAG: hypothetical protein M9904_15695 [Chitinophagaceae bacterium]|nr:hypothetical protein [Chitinophagaceae bacterium]